MYCESCGTFIPDGQSFCSNCGAKAPVIMQTAAVQQPAYQIEEQPSVRQSAPGEPYYPQNDVLTEISPDRVINKDARMGLIFGIVSVVTVYIPLTNIVPAILAIIFSLKGFKKVEKLGGKGSCIAGLALAASGIVFWIIMICSLIRNALG